MLGDKAVTIKALRWRGGIIEWNYDSPQQCARFWKELTETGRAPDTGELLVSANYFRGTSTEPHKEWWHERPELDAAADLLGVTL